MYLHILIIPFIYLFLYCYNLNSELTIKSYTHNKLDSFDQTLLKIEDNMKERNYKQVCLDSKKGSYIINTNIDNLITLEKYYHWDEINRLLVNIATDICN